MTKAVTPVRSVVPCNGCTACCEHDQIMLHPEHGDRPEEYLTVPAYNPITGKPGLMLQRKADGSCVYLERGVGCTIHGRAPAICREFDCRRFWRDTVAPMSRPDRRRLVREGWIGKDVLDAGKARVHTLEEEVAA